MFWCAWWLADFSGSIFCSWQKETQERKEAALTVFQPLSVCLFSSQMCKDNLQCQRHSVTQGRNATWSHRANFSIDLCLSTSAGLVKFDRHKMSCVNENPPLAKACSSKSSPGVPCLGVSCWISLKTRKDYCNYILRDKLTQFHSLLIQDLQFCDLPGLQHS